MTILCRDWTGDRGVSKYEAVLPEMLTQRELEFDDEFADVGAGEEHVDGFGSVFEALDDSLTVFDFAHHFPHAELFAGFHKL